eukprot:7389992-Alexandrium_andersonii.AAC.1
MRDKLLEPLGGLLPPRPPGWRLQRERPLRGATAPRPPGWRLRCAGGASRVVRGGRWAPACEAASAGVASRGFPGGR